MSNEAQFRKGCPIFSGVVAYFPDALTAVARVSQVGNDQHNPGQPLHWDRSKSKDELDALTRHLKDRASGLIFDTDRQRHLAKVAWRALAALQKEIEGDDGLLEAPDFYPEETPPMRGPHDPQRAARNVRDMR